MKNLFDSIKSKVHLRSEECKVSNERRVGRLQRRRGIAELQALSDSQLRDIGINRGSIMASLDNRRAEDRAA